MAVARETLEGNLRGVLSTLTPEEVNQDREKFAGELLHEADHDLARLGLELDTLKIQHVSDDKGYLDSIGRRQTAELFKRSRIAEAENHALAAENAASNLQNQEIAKVEAEIATARAEGQRRIAEAQTRKGALIAESKGQVPGAAREGDRRGRGPARAARAGPVPADRRQGEAGRGAQGADGRSRRSGAASKIIEEGKATAAAIRSLGETWAKAGDSARQIFVAQKLQSLVGTMMQTVGDMPIDKLTVIDKELAANGGNFAVKAAVTAEQLKQMLGVDLAALAQRVTPSCRRRLSRFRRRARGRRPARPRQQDRMARASRTRALALRRSCRCGRVTACDSACPRYRSRSSERAARRRTRMRSDARVPMCDRAGRDHARVSWSIGASLRRVVDRATARARGRRPSEPRRSSIAPGSTARRARRAPTDRRARARGQRREARMRAARRPTTSTGDVSECVRRRAATHRLEVARACAAAARSSASRPRVSSGRCRSRLELVAVGERRPQRRDDVRRACSRRCRARRSSRRRDRAGSGRDRDRRASAARARSTTRSRSRCAGRARCDELAVERRRRELRLAARRGRRARPLRSRAACRRRRRSVDDAKLERDAHSSGVASSCASRSMRVDATAVGEARPHLRAQVRRRALLDLELTVGRDDRGTAGVELDVRVVTG